MFYKKNPEIKEVVAVEGTSFDDTTVVEDPKYAKWADVNTFPDWTPSLVVVSIDEMSKDQRESLNYYRAHKVAPPPRHLGVITTKNFENTDDGAKVSLSTPITTHTAPIPTTDDDIEAKLAEEQQAKAQKIVEEKAQNEVVVAVADERIKVESFTNTELIAINGITAKNVAKVKKKFTLLEDLVNASNVDMKISGIKSNFFNTVREGASQLLEERDNDA